MNIFEVRARAVPQEQRQQPDREQSFLIKAKSGSAAMKHVARKYLHSKAEVAPNVRVAELMERGVKVEEVKESEQ